MSKAMVLLSGGLDSAVCLRLMLQNEACHTIGFDYEQEHLVELEYAANIADYYKVPFQIVKLPRMPLVNDVVFAGRNMVFASIAISIAQAHGDDCVVFGCNKSDWERFPDCRPNFWISISSIATTYGVDVQTPLINLTKRKVVQRARELAVPIEMTWSCYHPDEQGQPCMKCLACSVRQQALLDA